jgi:hypothetical protein
MPSALQEEDEANEAPPEESLSLDGSSSAGNGTLVPQKPPLAIADVVQSYLDKRSSVLTLDTVHPETYREGVILKKGHKRFGVFCINAGDKQAKIDKQVAYFEAYQVDFIVAVVPDIELAKGTAGIDIVLSTQEEDLFIMGETKGTTFYVCAPTEGSVGAILISPSNVVSAKVLSEL